MVVSHTTTLDIEDIVAIAITCEGCGTSAMLPMVQTDALTNKAKCLSCGHVLWRGGDDTMFARALLAARVGKLNRFALVIDQP